MTGRVQLLRVEGFRSIKGLEIKFDDVNLITGPNGCGKSNLFNAFRLIKSAMEGRLAAAIADEGGMESILWAGRRQADEPVRMKISLVADPFEYSLELGLRPASAFPLFPLDPQIKSEVVKLAGRVMVDRKSSVAKMRGLSGPLVMRNELADSESIFSQIGDPEQFHYLYTLRELVGRWTFYHEFRTDADSPLRRPALATYSAKLKDDGSNLGPILYVISKQGDFERLKELVEAALPDTGLIVHKTHVELQVEGIFRPVNAREISDGTLKLLCLAAACFAFRPPPVIAFNEPETSLNPMALGPLADMLAYAAQFSQLWITTHSDDLSKALVERLACRPIRLDKIDGETVREGLSLGRGWRADDE